MASTDTFESLILEAKEAGKGWHRSDDANGAALCENGRCVLGAVMAKRLPADYVAQWRSTTLPIHHLSTPLIEIAAEALGISEVLADRVALANDGRSSPEDVRLLDKLLGISQEA